MSIGIGNCSLGFVPRVALAIADDVNSAQVNECLAGGVDLVEFRVDQFEDNSVENSCIHLKEFSDISCIGTIRSKKEGGNWSGDEKARCALYKEIIPFVNAVDIEIGASDIVDDVVKKAKQSDVTVIGSYHNFVNTPMPDVLTGILEEGKDLGVKEGKIEAAREMLIDALFEKFNEMPSRVSERIRTIQNHDALRFLFRQVFRCDDMEAFEAVLSRLE